MSSRGGLYGVGVSTVREECLALLRRRGITTIFGNPGSTELPMFRDFPDDFRYVLALQEAVAVGAADGFAQATGRPAVVNLHSAAGVGHGLGCLYSAHRNRSPVVVVAGQQARSLLTGEPFLYAERPTEFPAPYVKFAREPARAADVPATLARALHVAATPPCGPVMLSVPVDDWDAPAAGPVPAHDVHGAVAGDPDALAAVAADLAAARSPVLVVGGEVDRDDAFDDVVALAERHRARVWAAPMSPRCGFPESHPLFAGFLPPSKEGVVAALTDHDLVVVLGSPVFPYHTEGAGPLLPDGARLVALTEDAAQAAWTPQGTTVVTGMRPGARALLAGPDPVERAQPAPRAPAPTPDPTVLDEALLMATLAELRPADSVIVEEAPASRPTIREHLPIDRPHGFHTGAAGALGHGLPAAVGIALARPDRRVIALLGDGSAMYTIQALWTAARLGVDLTVVIVDNGRYQALDEFAEHFGIAKPVGTALPGLDLTALATGQGVPARRVTRAADLAPALREALASPGPALVDVEVP